MKPFQKFFDLETPFSWNKFWEILIWLKACQYRIHLYWEHLFCDRHCANIVGEKNLIPIWVRQTLNYS